MKLFGFNVMLQVEDAVGPCFVTYGVVAGDQDQAVLLVSGAAQAEGFWSIELDEAWQADDGEDGDLGDVPEVLGRTDPVYLDEDEIDA